MFGTTNTGNTGTNFVNISVSFSLQSTPDYAEYPYRATYTNSSVTATTYAEVTYSSEQASSGKYAPFCTTYAGGIYLYANAAVGTVTIPTLTIGVPSTSPNINLLSVYPVGSIYMSVASTNPSSLFGGTWEALAPGRVLMGAGDSSYPAGSTGGEATHTLTVSEMPAHTHSVTGNVDSANATHSHTIDFLGTRQANMGAGARCYVRNSQDGGSGFTMQSNSDNATHSHGINLTSGSAGGGQSHNNLQPYLVVYMWKRTA